MLSKRPCTLFAGRAPPPPRCSGPAAAARRRRPAARALVAAAAPAGAPLPPALPQRAAGAGRRLARAPRGSSGFASWNLEPGGGSSRTRRRDRAAGRLARPTRDTRADGGPPPLGGARWRAHAIAMRRRVRRPPVGRRDRRWRASPRRARSRSMLAALRTGSAKCRGSLELDPREKSRGASRDGGTGCCVFAARRGAVGGEASNCARFGGDQPDALARCPSTSTTPQNAARGRAVDDFARCGEIAVLRPQALGREKSSWRAR